MHMASEIAVFGAGVLTGAVLSVCLIEYGLRRAVAIRTGMMAPPPPIQARTDRDPFPEYEV